MDSGNDPVEAAREWAGQDFSRLKTPSKAEQARLLAMLPEGDSGSTDTTRSER